MNSEYQTIRIQDQNFGLVVTHVNDQEYKETVKESQGKEKKEHPKLTDYLGKLSKEGWEVVVSMNLWYGEKLQTHILLKRSLESE